MKHPKTQQSSARTYASLLYSPPHTDASTVDDCPTARHRAARIRLNTKQIRMEHAGPVSKVVSARAIR